LRLDSRHRRHDCRRSGGAGAHPRRHRRAGAPGRRHLSPPGPLGDRVPTTGRDDDHHHDHEHEGADMRVDPMRAARLGAGAFAPVFTVVGAAFLALVAVVPARAAMDIREITTDGGITAWFVQDDSVPIVTIRFAFEGGTTQDPEGKAGLANLMTGLFDEGAADLKSAEFQEQRDVAGADRDLEAGKDAIYGTMRMLADKKDAAFELLRLAVNEPRFDEGPVDRIRAQIKSGILADSRDPEEQAEIAFSKAIYGAHPYSRRKEG